VGKIINFSEAKQALETGISKRANRTDSTPRPKKVPIVLTVMPDQSFPVGHTDLRPLLQRDGLILLSWGIIQDWDGIEPNRYIVHWMKSHRPHFRYASTRVLKDELADTTPQRRGDRFFYKGIHSTWDPITHGYHNNNAADYEYLVAPFDLDKDTVPGFIRVLKAYGSTLNFDYNFSLGEAKAQKSQAREYIDKIALAQL